MEKRFENGIEEIKYFESIIEHINEMEKEEHALSQAANHFRFRDEAISDEQWEVIYYKHITARDELRSMIAACKKAVRIIKSETRGGVMRATKSTDLDDDDKAFIAKAEKMYHNC